MKISFRKCFHLAGLALALSACSGEEQTTEKKAIQRIPIPENPFKPTELEQTIGDLIDALADTEPQTLQMGVILKELNDYWEPVKLGSNRALAELEVPGVVVGPAEATPEEATAEQIQIIEQHTQSGYEGLAVAPLAAAVSEAIDAAVDSGIPVVTLDGDLPESKRQLYIGTINYEAGRTAGETLAALLPEDTGAVVILGHDGEDWPDGYRRTLGAKDVLERQGYEVIVRKTNWTDSGASEDVEYMTEALNNAETPVVGMLSMFSPTYRCAMAAEAAGKTSSDVTIVGFDFEPETLRYMRSGLVRATHAQRQYYMGYLVPYVLYSLKVLGVEQTKSILAPHMVDQARFDAGLDVVMADQIDEYNAFLDALEIGG